MMEIRRKSLLCSLILMLSTACVATAAEAPDPVLQELPTGVVIERTINVPAAQMKLIGEKLGGKIQRLANTVLRVHGRSLRVNIIRAVDDSNGGAIYDSLKKIKSFPFCFRDGSVVVEFVGQDVDRALAMKTLYELGLVKKPDTVRYLVTAELATVDQADSMACNAMFNHFLALKTGRDNDAAEKISELASQFKFGSSLTLKNPSLGGESTKYTFKPPATDSKTGNATTIYSFDEPSIQQGVPFVTATIEVSVSKTGLWLESNPASERLTAATPFWPADDPTIKALARRITAGRSTNGGKVTAILEWLSPGKHIKYSGRTGSRWGTRKVFEQRFGHCWDFSDCFVTLARAAGVPSRQVAGWLYGGSGHVWAEFYRDGKGWQQVDPTGGGELPCGIYHIPYFASEDGEMPFVYLSMPAIQIIQSN